MHAEHTPGMALRIVHGCRTSSSGFLNETIAEVSNRRSRGPETWLNEVVSEMTPCHPGSKVRVSQWTIFYIHICMHQRVLVILSNLRISAA